MRIFLGGTCGLSDWRKELIFKLEKEGIDYYNPVVPDWTPDCAKKENEIKEMDDTVELYVITSDMLGVYSIAEAVQASCVKPLCTIFMLIEDRFEEGPLRSLLAVKELIASNGATVVDSFDEVVTRTKEIFNFWDGVSPIKPSDYHPKDSWVLN